MKRFVIIAVLILAVLGGAYAQDMGLIVQDLSSMLEGIGNDITPYLQQEALSGDGIGRASFGEGSKWFIAGSLGATFTGGALTFIEPTNSSFDLLNVYNLMTTALGGDTAILDTIQGFFLLPSTRLSFGIRFPFGIETIVQGSFIPAALTAAIANAAGMNASFSSLNLGVRVRKVLMEDSGGFPAVSLGAGYNFANTSMAIVIPAINQDFGAYYLELDGTVAMDTYVHTAGLDLAISKKLAIFYPFFKVSPYYQWTTYSGRIADFNAAFRQTSDDSLIAEATNNPAAAIVNNDLSLLLSAGFELALGKFIIMPSASFDVGTTKFHANLTFRLHF